MARSAAGSMGAATDLRCLGSRDSLDSLGSRPLGGWDDGPDWREDEPDRDGGPERDDGPERDGGGPDLDDALERDDEDPMRVGGPSGCPPDLTTKMCSLGK